MNHPSENNSTERKTIDISLKLLLIFILVAWCSLILFPFVTILLWSIILSITLYPVFVKLTALLKGREKSAAAILTFILVLLVLVPVSVLIVSMVNELKQLGTALHEGSLRIPPPDPRVSEWPLIGDRLFQAWKSLNENMQATLLDHREQLKSIGQKVLSSMMSVTSNVIMFTASILISGVMLASTDTVQKSSLQFSERLAGDMGASFISMIIQTIRNVAKGIIGVAFIQFTLMGLSFAMAGVPLAGVWALMVLVLALIQLPTLVVALPVIIYIYSVKEPLPATFWTVCILIAGLSDNVLKPWLMGKGAPVPMLVIFLGSIGGFILSGFIGLFTGAIVLSLGYKLMGVWLQQPTAGAESYKG